MFNKLSSLLNYANQQWSVAKQHYDHFKLYDVGSFVVNRLTSSQGFSQQSDIIYGPHPRHRLDLFKTQQPKPNRPIILFVHGGAWSHGDKKDYYFVGQAFATQGYDVAILNYRLAPEYIFPSSVDDTNLALDYLLQHQAELGIQTEQVVLLGHSAGAFNIMSALYQSHDQSCAIQDKIKAVVGLAGPYHFDYKDDPLCADAFDQSVSYQQVMPYYFVKSNAIQHYLLVAENDQIVAKSNATDFYAQLHAHHNHAEILIIPKTGHLTIMASISSLFSRFFSTKSEILNVLDHALSRD